MAELVATCPRCAAREMTFDVYNSVHINQQYGWLNWFEVFSVCRNCRRPTIFVIAQSDIKFREKPETFKGSLNPCFKVDGFINLSDRARIKAPEYTQKEVAAAFDEAAACMTVRAWNGAAAMLRLSIDLATKPLLPADFTPGLNRRTRRDLAPRLQWLIDNGKLPAELSQLSDCIREDGNDGVHDGTLGKEDAEDLLDFAIAMFERMYTEPERLRLAKSRRDKRRGGEDK